MGPLILITYFDEKRALLIFVVWSEGRQTYLETGCFFRKFELFYTISFGSRNVFNIIFKHFL